MSRSGACLAVALLLATAQPDFAQSPQQAPPAQAQPQAPPVAQAPPEQAPPPRRPTKRKARTSNRQPSSSGHSSFDEPRGSRDGGPSRQEVVILGNVMGGYDDNLTAGLGTGGGTAPTAMASGTTAMIDGTLGYFRGNNLRSIRLDTTGTLTAYPGYLDHPAGGGIVNFHARTNAGRSTTLAFTQRVGYEPFFNTFSQGAGGAPLLPGTGPGGTVPAASLFERRSWNSNTSVSLDRRWGRSGGTSIGYAYRLQEFIEDDNGDNTTQNVTAGYRHRLGTGVRARADYRYQTLDYTDSASTNRPTRDHRIEAGPEMEKQLSRRRSLSVFVAAGAGYIQTDASATRPAYDTWVPMGSARLRLALSPTGYVESEYRRDFSLFQGVTDEVYTTDAAYVRTGGMITSRLHLMLGATYSNWQTPLPSGVNDTLNVYGATAQLRFPLSAHVAATLGYHYYHHRYSNPSALPEGFPAAYDRQAARFGFTVWAPIAGAPTAPPLTQR
jgi:hypothetical protein